MDLRRVTLIGCVRPILLVLLGAASASPVIHGPMADEVAYKPGHKNENGTELALVYIGSTDCGFCRVPALREAVRRAKDLLARRAVTQGRPFSATGVALDWSIEQGVAFLQDVGPFDQIVVGRNQYNLAVLDFVSHDAGAAPFGTPHLIVLEQHLRLAGTRILAGKARLIRRVVGTEIVSWVNTGAPLE